MLFYVIPGSTQEYSYAHYDEKDGLASATVYGMTQDKDGFMWFGTETGLSRFDGVHFKNYTTANGLPSNEVFGLYSDTKNRLWILSFKNAICYYWKGKFHNPDNDSVLKKIELESEARSIGENEAGDILIEARTRSYIITADQKVIALPAGLFQHNPAFSTKRRFDLKAGIGRFNADLLQLPDTVRNSIELLSTYCAPLQPNPLQPKEKRSYIFETPRSGLFIFDGISQSGRLIEAQKSHSVIQYTLLNDSTVAAMNELRNRGAKLFNVYKKRFVAQYLKDYTIHFLWEDIEGNFWFSTNGSGVFKLGASRFKTYTLRSGKKPLAVLDIQKTGDVLYLGCEKDQFWKLSPSKNKNFETDIWYKCTLITGDINLLKKHDRKVFINCASSNFLPPRRYNNGAKTMLLYNDTVLTSAVDYATLIYPHNQGADTLHTGRTTCAYKKDNVFYIGTLNGLYTLAANSKQEIFLGDSDPLFRSRISSFAESRDGTLWIATYENGIIGYKNGKITANIKIQNSGLSSNICRCLFVSGNMLWAGTDKGLNKIDIAGAKPTVIAKFTMGDGLNSDIINTIYVDKNMVYAGTVAGFNYFDESKVPQHAIAYIHLTDIIVSGQSKGVEINDLLLPHQDNNIRFEYTGISFLSAGAMTYHYRLRGLDDQWHITKETILNYTSLPSGKYVLQLEAVNKFGDHSKVLEWRFEIQRTLWETTWFRILVTLVAISIIWLIIRIRIKGIQQKEKEKRVAGQQISELEQMALRAQMNPHFIFNCLNSIQHYIIRQDVKGANFYLARFAALIRQTLDNSAKMYVTLAEEINFLSTYLELEQLQMEGAFTYSIDIDPDIKQKEIEVPNMVIQPYLENAIKHGVGKRYNGDRITLGFSIDQRSNMLRCIIADNGKGIIPAPLVPMDNPAITHRSQGMSITQSRIETLNRLHPHKVITIRIEHAAAESEKNKGTKVIIDFPL